MTKPAVQAVGPYPPAHSLSGGGISSDHFLLWRAVLGGHRSGRVIPPAWGWCHRPRFGNHLLRHGQRRLLEHLDEQPHPATAKQPDMAHLAVADATEQRAENRPVGAGCGRASFPFGAHRHHLAQRHRVGEPPPRGTVGAVMRVIGPRHPPRVVHVNPVSHHARRPSHARSAMPGARSVRNASWIGIRIASPLQQRAGQAVGPMGATGASALPRAHIGWPTRGSPPPR